VGDLLTSGVNISLPKKIILAQGSYIYLLVGLFLSLSNSTDDVPNTLQLH
jgi:hypothetical protein